MNEAPSVQQQAYAVAEQMAARIMEACLAHRNHDARAVERYVLDIETITDQEMQKLELLAAQGADASQARSAIARLAKEAIAKARNDGNVFAFTAAA